MVEKFFENREALWLSDEKINEKLKKILGSLPTMATFFEKKSYLQPSSNFNRL
jgi:hypothetical protein